MLENVRFSNPAMEARQDPDIPVREYPVLRALPRSASALQTTFGFEGVDVIRVNASFPKLGVHSGTYVKVKSLDPTFPRDLKLRKNPEKNTDGR